MASQGVGRRFGDLVPDDITSEQQRVIDTFTDGPRKGIGGPFAAMLRSPQLTDAVRGVGDHVRFNSSIPDHLNEMAILITARYWTAQYEFYAHRNLALRAGLRSEIPTAIAEGRVPPNMNDDEAAVYEFTTQLLRTGAVTDGAFDGIKSRFGETGVIDLVGAVGYYCLVSFVLNIDRFPLPEGEEAPLRSNLELPGQSG
jgi:4-carboxymuconolactone decarboxylase